jgi:hypothetical protein
MIMPNMTNSIVFLNGNSRTLKKRNPAINNKNGIPNDAIPNPYLSKIISANHAPVGPVQFLTLDIVDIP